MSVTEKNNVKSRANWKQDPDQVRNDILRVGSSIFARNGLSGARVDEIAAQTQTSKRMIYYYFSDKEGLYQACLEAAYAKVRQGESDLDLADMTPTEALAKLVAFTFDHHRANPDFIRMVMIENIHTAKYLRKSELLRANNNPAIDKLSDIIARGQKLGLFRPDLDPVELHWQISALSFFNVSNKHTFSSVFGDELFSETQQEALRDHTVDMILSYVRQERQK